MPEIGRWNEFTLERFILDLLDRSGKVPPGAVCAFAGATAPPGYKLCDGSAISRSNYPDLFRTLGTTYGVGDGSTTFNLPDFRGRVPVGEDGAAARLTASDTLGAAAGAEKHTLAAGELPSHTHLSSSGFFALTDGSVGGALGTNMFTLSGHSGITGGNLPAGGSHNNMQPYQIVNYIIKI